MYIDSNVFIYAFADIGELGDKCRKKLKQIRQGSEVVFTSTLTFDEVFWKVQKARGQQHAIEAAQVFLTMPHLMFVDATAEILWKGLSLIKIHNISPRDAIHAASAMSKGATVIFSEDNDFDKITGIEREFF